MGIKTPARRLVPITEAATYAHCHPNTIRRRIWANELTAFRIGRAIRVDLDQLDSYMDPTRGGQEA